MSKRSLDQDMEGTSIHSTPDRHHTDSHAESLWAKVQAQSEHGLRCGALQPLETRYEIVEQDNIPFVVYVLKNLQRKAKETEKRDENFDPFLPPDPDLLVTHLSNTHACVLNKFNVVDHHLLVVTREFEEQLNLLNAQDFAALWQCMRPIDGLAFYNAGQQAGASQRHKHLQLIPFPLMPNGEKLPVAIVMQQVEFTNGIGTLPVFDFQHAIASLPSFSDLCQQSDTEAGEILETHYHQLLHHLRLTANAEPPIYNLLITRAWMMVIPRSQEKVNGISLNSLAYAGTLLVKDTAQLEQLKQMRPITLLNQAAVH
ncbi:MAG: ATP adenylyltransferase family protein [Thainema sp.]